MLAGASLAAQPRQEVLAGETGRQFAGRERGRDEAI
jgi:hypothetical protein